MFKNTHIINHQQVQKYTFKKYVFVTIFMVLLIYLIAGCNEQPSDESLLTPTPTETPTPKFDINLPVPLNPDSNQEIKENDDTNQLPIQKTGKEFIQEAQAFLQLSYEQLHLQKCKELIEKGNVLNISITDFIPDLNEQITVKQNQIGELNKELYHAELPQFKEKIASMIQEFEKTKDILINQTQQLQSDQNIIRDQIQLLQKYQLIIEKLQQYEPTPTTMK